MRTIFQDKSIKKLASQCEALAHQVGTQLPADAFIQEALFNLNGEGRLYDAGTPCVGAVELELLGKRECLTKAVCEARGIALKCRHLDRIARQYGATPDFPSPERINP
ncbi:MAG: hypothetical protein M0R28_08290 [Pigmentiphaga sp.]|nr:hypothetical protein [Pigmentiphaga sp.]